LTKKRKKRKKPIAKPQLNLPNIAIIGLSIVIAFALFSIVDKVFYSEDKIEMTRKSNLAELLTVSTYEKEFGEKISIQVLNGSGEKGIAERFSNLLQNNGHDVVLRGNADHFSYKNSEIIIRNSNKIAAENIANLLGINLNNISTQREKLLLCDITLILGKDFKELKSFSEVLKVNPTF